MRSTTMMTNGQMMNRIVTKRYDGSPSAACHIIYPRWTGGGALTLRVQLRFDLRHKPPQLFDFCRVVCHDAAQKVGQPLQVVVRHRVNVSRGFSSPQKRT